VAKTFFALDIDADPTVVGQYMTQKVDGVHHRAPMFLLKI
jgi:hypothetical protein